MMDNLENWEAGQRILIILAHPDDPEFFIGATIARWIKAGHRVNYLLLTRGDKGANDSKVDPYELSCRREAEQLSAAELLGVNQVKFLNNKDGELVPTIDTRKEVVREIRAFRPDVIVTNDPTQYFINDNYINHPDHRAAGEITLGAIFPAAGNPLYFPELLSEELYPHSVREVWLCLSPQPNLTLDVTDCWDLKIKAILQHCSQIPNPEIVIDRQRKRRSVDSDEKNPRYEDKFKRLILRIER